MASMDATPCIVCAEALTETSEAICGACGKLYHLNQRSDLPGKDCGQVWINEEHLALEFACNRCLVPAGEGAVDDVLDLAEAAAALGYSAEVLQREADAGRVRHRKTGSGVYLFERGELVAYARR